MVEAESTVLKRIGGIASQSPEVDVFHDGEQYRAFGISQKAWGGEPLIDFIANNGNHQALPNSDIRRVTLNPSEGLLIEFSEFVVILRSHCLSDMYQRLLMQRVVFVCEADEASRKLAARDVPAVSQMIIGPRSELRQ